MKNPPLSFTLLTLTIFTGCTFNQAPVEPFIETIQNQEGKTLSTGTDSSIVEAIPFANLNEIVYVSEDQLLFYSQEVGENENSLMSYDFKTSKLTQIEVSGYSSVSISPDFKYLLLRAWESDQDSEYFIGTPSQLVGEIDFQPTQLDLSEFRITDDIYWENNETVIIEAIAREQNETGARSVVKEVLNVDAQSSELEYKKGSIIYSPSGKQFLERELCWHYGCLLFLKSAVGFSPSGVIDDVDGDNLYSWSPDERFLIYNTSNQGSKEKLWIFDTENDPFVNWLEVIMFPFNPSAVTVDRTCLNYGVSSKIDTKDGVSWIDNRTLLLKVTGDKTGFWLYDAITKQFSQISPHIEPNNLEVKITDVTISGDLTQITFIKDYIKAGQRSDTGFNPQELWIANLDGSEARMIYKNY